MEQHTRTVHVALHLQSEEMVRLRQTLHMYEQAYNAYSEWFFANKTVSKNNAHKALYAQLQSRLGMPSGLNQSARDKASANYKAYNSNNKKNRFGRKLVYRARSTQYKKNTSRLNSQGLLTFSLVNGKRAKVQVNIPQYFTNRYGDWAYQSAVIGIDRNGNPFAQLSFRRDYDVPQRKGKVVGVDRGIYNIIATSEGDIVNSKHLRGVKRRYRYNRRRLQRQVASGSRSAAARLAAMRGKEARFTQHVNHAISSRLAQADDVFTYALEDLNGLRKSVNRKGKGSAKRQSLLHNWSPAQLAFFLEYKCALRGIEVAYVSPAYTSQRCNRCGKVAKANRRGAVYRCSCGYVEHADINAAKNIRDKFTMSVQQYMAGCS